MRKNVFFVRNGILSSLEMKLLRRIVDNLVGVHLLYYKRKLVLLHQRLSFKEIKSSSPKRLFLDVHCMATVIALKSLH